MDAFYASVEQLDFRELRGKAIAVGGGEARGVVATARRASLVCAVLSVGRKRADYVRISSL